MDKYLPADSRASLTLDNLISPFLNSLKDASSLKEVIQAINFNLPPSVSHNTELRLRFNKNLNDINLIRELASDIARTIIGFYVTRGLPDEYDSEGNRHFYFMREDIIKWYRSDPWYASYFQQPQDEIITIEVRKNNIVKTTTMALTEDQMIGIAYGLNAMNNNMFTLKSNITNDIINVADIANHALIYRIPLTLATEKLKRPYQVDILQPNKMFITIQFVDPEFMQGIISVAQWYQLPDYGKNYLWKDLAQFTRDGLVPLEI